MRHKTGKGLRPLLRQEPGLSLTEDVIIKAAEIYASLYKRGKLVGDADILIAATALVKGFGVTTNNERHFRRIAGLHVENWHK